jgi:NAD-reducing hydrogenase small subunit
LDQVVKVDIHIPGCPPPADAIFYALSELAAGRKPVLKGKLLDWH